MSGPAPAGWSDPPAPIHRGGAGEPLVLLHGGGGTWRQWDPAIPSLERSHELLAVTLPGHWGGPTIPPGAPCDIHALTAAVERAMDEAGWETAHLAGGSLGSWVALELAKRGRARSVTAIAPAGGWTLDQPHWWAVGALYRAMHAAATVIARDPAPWASRPRLRRIVCWHHFSRTDLMSPDYCARTIVGFANCRIVGELISWARAHGGARELESIACPVLLAYPERDLILPKRRYGARLARLLPNAETIDLPGVGHVAMADDPQLVAATIADFTARATDAGGKR